MSVQWLSKSGELSSRVAAALEPLQRRLLQPRSVWVLRRLLLGLLAVWLLYSLASLLWALFPAEDPVPAEQELINPVIAQQARTGPAEVNLEEMRGWHLFGEVGAALPVEPVIPETDTTTARDGIEEGARETRLDLKLRGVVASTQDGLGHAIIEHRKKQAVYAVEDKLPVSGQVTLAKVMPRQVVLDNGGTYELLVLFEESELSGQVATPPARTPARPRTPAQIDKRGDKETTSLAQGYRDRLYENPQSLADVVSVSAVRQEGKLLGYRIAPGKDQEQFSQLGFKAGDLVTSVNGIALNDPANTMRLYQTMRTATEAVFDLRRGEQQVSVSVNLGEQQEGL